MGYFLITLPDRSPTRPLVDPKTHTPLLPVKERGLRYYNPEAGRWMSRDPVEEEGFAAITPLAGRYSPRRGRGDNYLYVSNKPADYIDPLGLFEWWRLFCTDWGECYAGDILDCEVKCADLYPRAITSTKCQRRQCAVLCRRWKQLSCNCQCDCALTVREHDPADPNEDICTYNCVGFGVRRFWIPRTGECPTPPIQCQVSAL